MVIYSIEELADILDFELHMERNHKGEHFNSYEKTIIKEDGKYIKYTLTKSPPYLGTEGTSYRLHSNAEQRIIGESRLSLKSKNIEDFNELIQAHHDFKKHFRNKNIDNILNSDD